MTASAFRTGSRAEAATSAAGSPSCNSTNAPSTRRCPIEGAALRAYQPPAAFCWFAFPMSPNWARANMSVRFGTRATRASSM